MEKLLILFLSIILLQPCIAQSKIIDCNDKSVQDSLNQYFQKNAWKLGYNHPNWQKYCDSVLAVCPNNANMYREKAIPYIKGGDYEKAFLLEDKAVELDPKKWLDYRAFLKCIFSKDYEGAIIDFDNAEKLSPNSFVMDHSYSFYKGISYLELRQYDEAEKCLVKDISLQTKGDSSITAHYNSYLYLGIVYFEKKKFAEAEFYLKKSLDGYSQLPDANFYLALTYKAVGNIIESKRLLDVAQTASRNGYKQNEDNEAYAYYPHQITLYEIEEELKKE